MYFHFMLWPNMEVSGREKGSHVCIKTKGDRQAEGGETKGERQAKTGR